MIQQIVLTDKEQQQHGQEQDAKITFRTTKALLRRLKHYAADNDISVTEILNEACEQFLKGSSKK